MAYPAFDYITPDEYLEIEVRSNEKHEYFDGRIYDMAGANLNHNFIVSNLTRKIGIFLDDKSCISFGSDLRITTPSFNSYMYPHISIIYDDVEIQKSSFDTATNPSVIIEVMSPSTKGYDMAFKFHYYKQIPSLLEYILVDSTSCFIQINRRRKDNSWEDAINIEDIQSTLPINTIGMQVLLKDIYGRTSFAKNK